MKELKDKLLYMSDVEFQSQNIINYFSDFEELYCEYGYNSNNITCEKIGLIHNKGKSITIKFKIEDTNYFCNFVENNNFVSFIKVSNSVSETITELSFIKKMIRFCIIKGA